MPSVRTHRYTLAPNQVEKFVAQRAEPRPVASGGLDLVETRLYRLEDGTYPGYLALEVVRGDGEGVRHDGRASLVGATLKMTSEHSAVDGDLVDER